MGCFASALLAIGGIIVILAISGVLYYVKRKDDIDKVLRYKK